MTANIIPITIVLLAIISSFSRSSEAAGRGGGGLLLPIYKGSKVPNATYWGQNGRRSEGSLRETCQKLGYNDIVIISSLTNFGSGRTPTLDLGGHCDPQTSDCSYISGDILSCRARGVLIFLSIGGDYKGDGAPYSMESDSAANELAEYIWNNFLGGFSLKRPLGFAGLDGIDFNVHGRGRWDILASRLKQRSWIFYKVRLSAAARCSIPEPDLDQAIRGGFFDYIWVKFFGDATCEYTTNAGGLLASWRKWVSYTPGASKLFLALPGISWAEAYVTPDELSNEILPRIQGNRKFGGVLIWHHFVPLSGSELRVGLNKNTTTTTTFV